MNYQRYVTICDRFGYQGERRAYLAREATMPTWPHLRRNPYVVPNLQQMPVFQAHPELLRVPIRLLKKWATRALKETTARAKRMTGPALATFRRRRL